MRTGIRLWSCHLIIIHSFIVLTHTYNLDSCTNSASGVCLPSSSIECCVTDTRYRYCLGQATSPHYNNCGFGDIVQHIPLEHQAYAYEWAYYELQMEARTSTLLKRYSVKGPVMQKIQRRRRCGPCTGHEQKLPHRSESDLTADSHGRIFFRAVANSFKPH